MRNTISVLLASLIACGTTIASAPTNTVGGGAIQANHAGGPPGLAKKGGIPPGLAKRFGQSVPAKAYIAIDPRYEDRAWFLIDGRWVLHQGFAKDVRLEVRSLMALPPIPDPPPVPLPSIAVGFHVVLFH